MNKFYLQVGISVVIGILAATGSAFSQVLDPPRPPSLKTVPVLEPTNLSEFVNDRQAAIRLGKALFWEMQVGSDGVTACASCHFSSGMADTRSKNQLSPGLKRITPTDAPNPDRTFHRNLGPVGQVTGSDFPFFPASNDVLSSQGVRNSVFLGIGNGPADLTRPEPDPDGFRAGSVNTRRVEPRNTPTVVNAVFNHRQFWDGRA
ncbi:MAG: cytochrome C peroxidase, partial [Nitrospira sp.]